MHNPLDQSPYPQVTSEERTLAAMTVGYSIARFGNCELTVALGGKGVAQCADLRAAQELRMILAEPPTQGVLVGIPNIYSNSPRREVLRERWATPDICALYNQYREPPYASSFVTRPDLAPWIDHPGYWDSLNMLWRDRNVTLVLGSMRSLRPDELRAQGATVREVWGPQTNACARVGELEREVGTPNHTVLICLGVAGTILAWRLGKRGVHAVDLGHVGMFLRHGKSHRHLLDDLISPQYQALLQLQHRSIVWGASVKYRNMEDLLPFCDQLGIETILDYGSGRESLLHHMYQADPNIRVSCYDPGVVGRTGLPKPVDLVNCADVLEHVEPDKLFNVLDHIYTLSMRGAYLVIALRQAKAKMVDGSDAHLIVKDADWWLDQLKRWGGWHIVKKIELDKTLRIWLVKK